MEPFKISEDIIWAIVNLMVKKIKPEQVLKFFFVHVIHFELDDIEISIYF